MHKLVTTPTAIICILLSCIKTANASTLQENLPTKNCNHIEIREPEEHIDFSLKSIEDTFLLLVNGFSKKSGVKTHIPKVLSNLIQTYRHPLVYDDFECQEREGRIKNKVYHPRMLAEQNMRFLHTTEHIDAWSLDSINYFDCDLPKLNIVIKNPNKTAISFRKGRFESIEILTCNTGHITFENIKAGSINLHHMFFDGGVIFKNVHVASLELKPKNNKGWSLKDRALVLNNVTVTKTFSLTFSAFSSTGAPFGHTYIIRAKNLYLAPECEIDIDPRIGILTMTSTITNAPAIERVYKEKKSGCCSNFCFCFHSTYMISYSVWQDIFCGCKEWDKSLFCLPNSLSRDHRERINCCCNTLLCCCLPCGFIACLGGCLSWPKCCKDNLPFLCCKNFMHG